ncbi:MAG: glutamate 5-kinase [Chloroflexi bacterium]|nr:glutamate 5-kinase [Chloroflexota bacterium]MCY3583660.1 glutamate 5-kinase [Chloroflexota bacterium]MCY3716767.1 glutamate 5-kinase [Chloroflexota bacterium]MDE2649134.1 glutamate 5-kinase [Chloroflexota bacterium]MXV93027.1 glutamate 5-kinase [Chloroflexota bacterium]
MKRIVIKLGSSVLTKGSLRLNRQRILELTQQVAHLHERGYETILVTSGAQAAGRERLDFPNLGKSVPAKQMLSAVGQGQLMRVYADLFDIFAVPTAQVLLTWDDLSNRERYLNARDTLSTLIQHKIIPIVNENDTIATQEIRVGDNDNLSALVASLVDADLLIILTDQPGIFTADPRKDPQAALIPDIAQISDDLFALAGGAGSSSGTGGMVTKLQAAQVASRSGIKTIIASGSEDDVIRRLVAGEKIGTHIEASKDRSESRKRWLLTDRPQGSLLVDDGAARVLLQGGASLLPVGIRAVQGDFERGAAVSVRAPDGREIARGLSNYPSDDLRNICGQKSSAIADILGYSYGDAVLHRNNLALL